MTTEIPPDVFGRRPSRLHRLTEWFHNLHQTRRERAELLATALADGTARPEPNLRIELPSANPEFPFQAELVVRYDTDTRINSLPAAPMEVAKGDICGRARQVTCGLRITAIEQCRAELELAVSEHLPAGQTGVVAWAHCTGVTADPDDQRAVAARAETLRRARMREWQWEEEEHQIARLAELITDPLRATAWWLLNHQNDIDLLDGAAEQFSRLRDRLVSLQPRSASEDEIPGRVSVVAPFPRHSDPGPAELDRTH